MDKVKTTVQTTFTKQKRELNKVNTLINSIRAQEKRSQRFTPDGQLETDERDFYVEKLPESIAEKVLEIVCSIVRQHGARQVANSTNKGRFEFLGIEADLSVPQLRALQEASQTLRNLVDKLPKKNMRLVPNCEIDGRPAFASPLEKVKETKTRWVPYVNEGSPKPLTYEEKFEVVLYQTREVTIDYGLNCDKIDALREMAEDLDVAIQVAIDQANAKEHAEDALLNDVIARITDAFKSTIAQ